MYIVYTYFLNKELQNEICDDLILSSGNATYTLIRHHKF